MLRRVLELLPGDVEAHVSLERVLARQGQLAAASEVLRRLLELEPRRSREFLQRLSAYALQLQRDEEALDFAAQALALNPGDAQGHLRLAQLHRQLGNVGQAVRHYQQTIELDDRLFDAYLELAELLETQGKPQESLRVYLRLLAKAPDDALVDRAGRQALLLAVMHGSLSELEHDLLPLALAHTERPVYRRVLVTLYGNLTWSLVQTAHRGTTPEATAARQELTAIGQRSLQPLLDALLDHDPAQQQAALSMLGHLGHPAAAVPLVAFAQGDGSPVLQARALIAAGMVGDQQVAPSLIEILEHSRNPTLQEAAAFGLGRLATPGAAAALARSLNSPLPSLRTLACIGLGRARDRRSLGALLERLSPDQEPSQLVQAAAAWALGFLEEPTAASGLSRVLRSGPP